MPCILTVNSSEGPLYAYTIGLDDVVLGVDEVDDVVLDVDEVADDAILGNYFDSEVSTSSNAKQSNN